MIRTACHNIFEDGDYDISVEQCKIIVDMAIKLYDIYQHPNDLIIEFSKWLHGDLAGIVKRVTKRYKKTSSINEKLWHEYHILCSSSVFTDKWSEFLTAYGLSVEPLFY